SACKHLLIYIGNSFLSFRIARFIFRWVHFFTHSHWFCMLFHWWPPCAHASRAWRHIARCTFQCRDHNRQRDDAGFRRPPPSLLAKCLQVISARLHWAVHQQLVAMATREESGFDCHNGQHCAMSSTVLRSTWSR